MRYLSQIPMPHWILNNQLYSPNVGIANYWLLSFVTIDKCEKFQLEFVFFRRISKLIENCDRRRGDSLTDRQTDASDFIKLSRAIL